MNRLLFSIITITVAPLLYSGTLHFQDFFIKKIVENVEACSLYDAQKIVVECIPKVRSLLTEQGEGNDYQLSIINSIGANMDVPLTAITLDKTLFTSRDILARAIPKGVAEGVREVAVKSSPPSIEESVAETSPLNKELSPEEKVISLHKKFLEGKEIIRQNALAFLGIVEKVIEISSSVSTSHAAGNSILNTKKQTSEPEKAIDPTNIAKDTDSLLNGESWKGEGFVTEHP